MTCLYDGASLCGGWEFILLFTALPVLLALEIRMFEEISWTLRGIFEKMIFVMTFGAII